MPVPRSSVVSDQKNVKVRDRLRDRALLVIRLTSPQTTTPLSSRLQRPATDASSAAQYALSP